jgi:hypothetical protein
MQITEKIKTFKDACIITGHSFFFLSVFYWIISFLIKDGKAIIAFSKLSIITDALNEGWKKDWANTSEYIYYPWWYVETYGSSAGLASAYSSNAASFANAYIGSRLGFKNSKLAQYAGTQFKDLYETFILK